MALLIDLLKTLQAAVDREILGTRSGDRRNLLCDANIHLMEAQELLVKATREG